MVTVEDKDGSLLLEAMTDANGRVVISMRKAGKICIYTEKTGYAPTADPDVQVINRGSKNNLTTYMKRIAAQH